MGVTAALGKAEEPSPDRMGGCSPLPSQEPCTTSQFNLFLLSPCTDSMCLMVKC